MPLNSNERLLRYLPAIYHESQDLRQLLAVLEKILYTTGESDRLAQKPRLSPDSPIPIVASIGSIAALFDPGETPPDFLPWLSHWVALTHFEGLSPQRHRELIAEIVPLYAQKGTKSYLQRLLKYFIPDQAEVSIDDQLSGGFEIGDVRIGINSRLGQDRDFWFRVEIKPSDHAENPVQITKEISRCKKQIRRVIEFAKPAYTLCELV